MSTPGLQFIRPISDIHLDFDIAKGNFPWTPPGLTEDHLTALVIAGDIWHSRKYLSYANKSWLADRAERFRYVIFVLGNHDYWGGTYNNEIISVNAIIKQQGLKNVFLLQDNIVDLEGIRFIGGTLWTDFNKQDPLTKMSWKNIMLPDATKIKKYVNYIDHEGKNVVTYTKLSETDLLESHQKTKKFIFKNSKKNKNIKKLVVVTHMAPSFLSIDEVFKNSFIDNGYFYSELGNEIADSEIDYWIHGHTHNSKNYLINNTNIINNPRGYVGYETRSGFNPNLLIKL